MEPVFALLQKWKTPHRLLALHDFSFCSLGCDLFFITLWFMLLWLEFVPLLVFLMRWVVLGSSFFEPQVTRHGKQSSCSATVLVVSVCGAGGPCSKITNWLWKSSFGPSVFVATIKTLHSLAVEITRGRAKRDASVVHATIVVVWVLLNLLFVSCCSTNEQDGCSHCCCLGVAVVVVLVVVGIIVVQSNDCVAIAPFPPRTTSFDICWSCSLYGLVHGLLWSMNPTKGRNGWIPMSDDERSSTTKNTTSENLVDLMLSASLMVLFGNRAWLVGCCFSTFLVRRLVKNESLLIEQRWNGTVLDN